MLRAGVPRGPSGQAGARLPLLSQSHSVSPEFLHSWHFASCLDSDEPEPHSKNYKKQEDEQCLGQETEGSGRLLQSVANIWDRRRQGERGSPEGRSGLGGRHLPQIPHRGSQVHSLLMFLGKYPRKCIFYSRNFRGWGLGSNLNLSKRLEGTFGSWED